MKTLVYLALALTTLIGWSQPVRGSHDNRNPMKEKLAELSPEQLADLKTKKMTLQLDLDEKQQQQIHNFHLNQIQNRRQEIENGKKPKDMTAYELYAFKSQQLDRQIAAKDQLRSILSEEQFDKLEKSVKRGKAMMLKRASRDHGRRP
ncbi:hypothetical protein [Aureitalea marina]|uniref:Uncharacterized protein n=1 Tax=Aureitalea marina TaxID=930804 RepID=A0A2S7KQW5_9FLAO|nr:hypothetical protein [Aureitalea marina]PQB05015.1 hypothetical protein BST85_09010 [Aureitalea marina]